MADKQKVVLEPEIIIIDIIDVSSEDDFSIKPAASLQGSDIFHDCIEELPLPEEFEEISFPNPLPLVVKGLKTRPVRRTWRQNALRTYPKFVWLLMMVVVVLLSFVMMYAGIYYVGTNDVVTGVVVIMAGLVVFTLALYYTYFALFRVLFAL